MLSFVEFFRYKVHEEKKSLAQLPYLSKLEGGLPNIYYMSLFEGLIYPCASNLIFNMMPAMCPLKKT